MSKALTSEPRISVLRSPRRLLLAGLGLLSVGLAILGAILPGVPTTIFLIAASYFFARSCPWLEERLFRIPLFRPFLPYVYGEREMPMSARLLAIGSMWLSVGVSLVLLSAAGTIGLVPVSLIVSAATAGSVVIWRFKRGGG